MPGQGHFPGTPRIQIGDLVGIPGKPPDTPPRIALVRALFGGRADLHPFFPPAGGAEGPLVLPLRQLEWIATPVDQAGPSGGTPTPTPWNLGPEDLAKATPRRRDLAAAWQVLVADPGPGKDPRELSLAAFAELVCGRGDPVQRCACWLWLHGPQTFFRLRQGRIQPRPAEELKRLRQDRHRLQLLTLQQTKWVRALRERSAVEADQLGANQARELAELRHWASGQGHGALPDSLQSLLQQVRCSREPVAVRHLLADVGLWPRHHLPSLDGTSWHRGFPEPLLREAGGLLEKAEECLPGDAERWDLTRLHTVTIDDEDTTDLDDALSLEWVDDGSPRIWIHVADPGRLVDAGSPLDLEALRRGTSLYLGERILPMFPEILANGVFSLRAGQRSAAWSLGIQLAEDGSIAAMHLSRSWVRPAYRLSYGDADELLQLAPPQERDLLTLQGLLERRRRWRAERGALFLDQAEGRIRRCDGAPQGDGASLEIIEPTASRQMVAEAMILAGAAVAEYGVRHGLPLPFRSQPAAALPSPQELEGLPAGPVRLAAIRRCLTRGIVGTRPLPHFSLGVPAYVQATSPIRRYGDLLAQRQLAAHRAGHAPLDEMALSDLLSRMEGGVREGMAITREDQRHWQQVWFDEHRGLQWRGVFLRWLRQEHHLALVHLEELALELPAECSVALQPGQELLVRLREVDPLRDLLRLDARAL